MSAVTDKVSPAQFRAAYAERKPYYELVNGEATLAHEDMECESIDGDHGH